MTTDQWIQIGIAAATNVTAVVVLVITLRNGHRRDLQHQKTSDDLEVIRLDVNDKMKKFIELAQKASFAEGEKAESEKREATIFPAK